MGDSAEEGDFSLYRVEFLEPRPRVFELERLFGEVKYTLVRQHALEVYEIDTSFEGLERLRQYRLQFSHESIE